MRLALGMMIHEGDAPWLSLHLPAFARCFDGAVISIDPRESLNDELVALTLIDGNTIYGSNMVKLVVREFDNDWSAQFNSVIEMAEIMGYDAIVRLDPDEAIFSYDVEAIRELLEQYSILCFARYNFWRDRMHYTPGIYPDWQARSWILNKGIRLGGQHHEGIGWTHYSMFEGDPIADTPRQVLRVPSIHIYHYGNVGKERILERDLHYVNVDREKAGHPPLTELPPGREFPTRHSIAFWGPQPIIPIAGIYAPYKE